MVDAISVEADLPLDSLSETQAKYIIREMARIQDGYRGFTHFCKYYVKIEDKVTNSAIAMNLFDCQRTTVQDLLRGRWLVILKARQLGMTWTMAAFCLWSMICKPLWEGAVMNQDAAYAMDFLNRIRFMHSRLPNWLRPKMTTDQKEKIRFDDFGHGAQLRSLAATEKSCRSVTGNFVLCDEAAYIDLLLSVKSAAEPAIAAGGAMVIMSTSNGPKGAFYDTWQASPGNRYHRLFFPWWERPGRDQKWYDAEVAASASNPLHVKREFPANPDEAWESASGRVFPTFDQRVHERTLAQLGFGHMEESWDFYRSIDWGGTDPFVCIFAALIPEKVGFSIDPTDAGNREAVRELKGYRWKGDRVPERDNNHFIDALRYLCTSTKIKGHLHIYKTLYIHTPAEKYDFIQLMHMVKKESAGTTFTASFADRTRRDSIKTFNENGIPVKPYRALSDKQGAVLHGIDVLNTLLRGVNRLHVASMPDMLKVKYDGLRRETASLSLKDLMFMEQYKLTNAEHALVHPILGSDF